MRIVYDGTVLAEGQGADLRDQPIGPDAVEMAVTGDHPALTVDCPEPRRWWESLRRPDDGTPALDRIVDAARSRGHHPPAERALATAQRDLQRVRVETVDTAASRRRLADAGTEVDRLRERVAAARGRLESRRELGADTAEAAAALDDATRQLSEAETERIAAEQAHDAARRRARDARAARERRLRLQDRVANRRRDARRALATAVSERFAAAVEAVPGSASLSLDPLGVDGDPITAALAAARVADLRAPVVDATGRFDGDVEAAVAALDDPVVLV
ncbi:hypothetical protein JCM30237_18180 [Halolamina litorea]|uniref:Uncharacterized protein n=1 Tax=Halolamina litorea TaxID=1515593 RepID=A0ABD6BSA2_9EURY|nr:hypothetical protein [Halolamina litorea]